MANVKISELTALTPPDAADLVPVTDSSASQTKRTTVGEIVGIINGDVDVANDGAATISELPVSKLQDGAARQLLQTDAAGTGVEWTSNVELPGTLGVTGQSTLASAAVSDLTSGRLVLAGTSGELEDSAGLTFNGTQLDVDGDVVITGDLTVEGASTILETETVRVEDKNIELGVVASPTDVTADGGGITLKGTTDKTINWIDATAAWTSSEHVDLASGKSYRINGTEVLSSTTLGSGVTGSSLTSVGTLDSLTVTGSATAGSFIPTSNTPPTNGIYLSAANTVALSSDSNPRLTIDGSGNLAVDGNTFYVDAVANRAAVGTSNPASVFNAYTTDGTVYSPSTAQSENSALMITNGLNNNNNIAQITFRQRGVSSYDASIGASGGSGSFLFFKRGGQERMRLTSTGLGIGSNATAPLATLHVKAPVSATPLIVSDQSSDLLTLDSAGRLLIATSSQLGGALLQVNGDRIRVATAKTPSSASDTGSTGEICWDADYIYVCTAANTWKRTALSTW